MQNARQRVYPKHNVERGRAAPRRAAATRSHRPAHLTAGDMPDRLHYRCLSHNVLPGCAATTFFFLNCVRAMPRFPDVIVLIRAPLRSVIEYDPGFCASNSPTVRSKSGLAEAGEIPRETSLRLRVAEEGRKRENNVSTPTGVANSQLRWIQVALHEGCV